MVLDLALIASPPPPPPPPPLFFARHVYRTLLTHLSVDFPFFKGFSPLMVFPLVFFFSPPPPPPPPSCLFEMWIEVCLNE